MTIRHVVDIDKRRSPAISIHVAVGLTVLFTIIYIAPFYFSPTLRSNSVANRNTPSVIEARIRAVIWSCVASVVITVSVLYFKGHATPTEVFHLLGMCPVNLLDTAKSFLLVVILFAGPLFERAIIEGDWRTWGGAAIKATVYNDLIGWRNLVVGPVSEELVFRSLAISLFVLAQATAQRITFTSPLIFGVAHVHHLHETINSSRRPGASYLSTALTPSVILPGLLRSIFQFLYTSLFGFIAAFIYLRTSSLVACILAHSFCNWMGLPRFWGRVGEELGEEMLDQNAGDSMTDILQAGANDQRLSIAWTVAYYVVLFTGAIAFWKLRWSLTHSDLALVKF
ncbi:CaaX prenyl proteinase Rce1 [Aureobasidium subglaciale]|nr:CaaX prenyl proteinase Rce1 [Aureobasidium subglaciale]KAI5222259.1 CaaX prenyl proteinase Rce1 [Aureobasidium subglaciale]KAI5226360.1 CaaX prenyl proteinase Rce1 [Aureobasidium subglaciale]KAI5262088.1 CaaX prenyl proteinase Rce1 [Aureobasidium subglaciale]